VRIVIPIERVQIVRVLATIIVKFTSITETVLAIVVVWVVRIVVSHPFSARRPGWNRSRLDRLARDVIPERLQVLARMNTELT